LEGRPAKIEGRVELPRFVAGRSLCSDVTPAGNYSERTGGGDDGFGGQGRLAPVIGRPSSAIRLPRAADPEGKEETGIPQASGGVIAIPMVIATTAIVAIPVVVVFAPVMTFWGVVVVNMLFDDPAFGPMVLEAVPRAVMERFDVTPRALVPTPMFAVGTAVLVVLFIAVAAMVVPAGPGEI
jgi:hypothetical protein